MDIIILRRVAFALLVVSTLVFIALRVGPFAHNVREEHTRSYTYKGNDFPSTWSLLSLVDVEMYHEDSVHYALETDLGIAEWNATLPSGGALVHLGPGRRPFTLSMFHQLRCLNIIREILVDFYLDSSPNATYKRPDLAQHCMDYLRQTVMCRADLRLENVRAPSGPGVTVSQAVHDCKDWTAVYDAAEDNYRELVANRNISR